MNAFAILLIGMAVVIGAVLVARLHSFLALVLGALVVAWLTSPDALEQFAHDKNMTSKAAQAFVEQPIGERIARGFGETSGKIGILIALASIIGKCLLDSGSADRIVRASMRLFGQSRAGLAFVVSSFALGIPVFFDTVFYLMIPLGKALRVRSGRDYLLYVLTITAGATMAHSLVPPTPGPLFVAAELGVSIGLMILGGGLLGIFTATSGYLFAHWANRRWDIPLRDSADASLADLEALSLRDESELPATWLALLPIALPVVLISAATIVDSLPKEQVAAWPSGLANAIEQFGNPNVALAVSAAIALVTLARQRRQSSTEMARAVESALMSGGVIILITSAGGAFGSVLQQTGIGAEIERFATSYRIAVLPLAFAVTALIRTAQGSATVAMITAVGVFKGMSDPSQLGFHPLYLALAIGCGSKPFSWMNDSGFWVISKMSGMTESETLKTVSPMTALMGVVGLIGTMIGSTLFPLL